MQGGGRGGDGETGCRLAGDRQVHGGGAAEEEHSECFVHFRLISFGLLLMYYLRCYSSFVSLGDSGGDGVSASDPPTLQLSFCLSDGAV